MWQDVLGFILLFIKSELAIIHFHAIDYTLLQTFLIVTFCTSFVILWLFFLTGVFDRLVIERMGFGYAIREVYWIRSIRISLRRGEKKLLTWFLKNNKAIIIIVFLLPFIPLVEPIAIIAAKMQKLKGIIPLILLANSIKIFIVTYIVYN